MRLAASLRGWGLLSALCTVIGSATAETRYTLSHRFSSASAYHTFSTFTLPLSLSSHSTDLNLDLEPESQAQLSEQTSSVGEGDGERYYLQLSGDGVDLETSTKACYLSPLHPPQVQVHLSSHGTPISLSLIIPSLPSNGSCPPSPLSSAQYPSNLQIRTTSPIAVRVPPLAGPINTDSTGQPVAPPPEKSFLQKYWLPIAGLAVFALSQLGDPAPPGQGGGGRPK